MIDWRRLGVGVDVILGRAGQRMPQRGEQLHRIGAEPQVRDDLFGKFRIEKRELSECLHKFSAQHKAISAGQLVQTPPSMVWLKAS